MSLQLILGSSGSGKSWTLYDKVIRESIKFPQKNFIVLVPEQSTMQAQKELVHMHPKKGIMNIDVLSFQRLAFRVFEEVGADRRTILEETGKSLVLRKIAGKEKEKLKVLGNNMKKPGYIGEMKSMISELAQYNIEAEDMGDILNKTKGMPGLHCKLQDISVIYQEYQDYLKDKYITNEELLGALSNVISQSAYIRGSILALDGFTGFTPVQNKVLYDLMRLASKVWVTACIDEKEAFKKTEGQHELFYLSKKTIYGLYEIANEEKIEIEEPQVIAQHGKSRCNNRQQLRFLEENLFRYNGKKYKKSTEEISIHQTKNPQEEIRFIGSKIRKLVQKEGLRYRDIAVVTGDLNVYGRYAEKEFQDMDIPFFMDEKRSILLNPFIEFIRCALDIIQMNYSYESVFRFLKCRLFDLADDEIDKLENYVIALGIRGFSRWNTQWVRLYRGMNEEELLELNAIRNKVMSRLDSYTKSMKKKKATVEELTKSLYLLITEADMQQKLKNYEVEFQRNGEKLLEKEYSQIYGMIMSLLDKLVDLLGEETISVQEYAKILDAGFEEIEVGVIPPGVDQVVVGDIERSRLSDVKVLFFAGLNDGIVPKAGKAGMILTDSDRENLQKKDVNLAPTNKENAYIQKFYLYLNMTKPSDRLYMSFSKTSADGKAQRPSFLVNNIQKMYPLLEIVDEEISHDAMKDIVTYKNGLPVLADGLRKLRQGEVSDQFLELYSYYYKNKAYRPFVEYLVDGAFYTMQNSRLSKASARILYGTMLENSVTRLERFAACAFSHFLDYGLKIREREEYSFASLDMGNIFHTALEIFSKKLEESPYDWFHLPSDARDIIIEECVEESVADYGNTILQSSARNKYIIQRIRRILKRTVWALQQQISKGVFRPSSYEISFAMADDLEAVNIALSDEEKIKLRGRIDRLDTHEDENNVYVKVVDYKSGNTSFDLVALYYGLQLQLVVYLNAAVEMQKQKTAKKNVVPAGIFYYNMNDPVIDRNNGDSPEEVNKRILKELKVNGLVNEDPNVIEMMDTDIEGSSDVIPVTFNKNGSLSRLSSTASSEQFQILSEFGTEKIKELGRNILSGDIKPEPYELNKKTACDFCTYKSICGFDTKVGGFSYRKFHKLEKDEVWKKMSEERAEKEE